MTVQFQRLGRSLVLVLDRDVVPKTGIEPGVRYRLEADSDHLTFYRLPDEPNPEPVAWDFENAQAWIAARYAPAFRVLAR